MTGKVATWGTYYWPYWIILTSVTFGIPELVAIFTNYLNTLSEYARHELNVSPHVTSHTIAWYVSVIVWLLFVVVITAHIWWDYDL